jgi:hypothetical protein
LEVTLAGKYKEHVYPEISQLKLRHLAKYDFREFQAAVHESKESISTFLDMGIELPTLNVIEFMNYYTSMLKDEKFEHFGVFHGYKMLGYACFSEAFSPVGTQIIYWVRESYLKQNIGTWLIGSMTTKSWVERQNHFSQLVIDKANFASRRIAKKMGYEPLYAMTTLDGQGTQRTGTYITYISISPALNMKAAAWEKRAIDLIGHPCMIDKFHHLIHDEIINEHYRWKFPVYLEDDLNSDGSFKDWIPQIDPTDPTSKLFV